MCSTVHCRALSNQQTTPPVQVLSEREQLCERTGQPVYRAAFGLIHTDQDLADCSSDSEADEEGDESDNGACE